MGSDLLTIYLRDQHAAAGAFVEVAKRSARANGGSELGLFLDRLASELADGRRELERAMRELGVARSRAKDVGAVVAERFGRLKLNGRVREYSPLSRVFELEGLALGVTMQLAVWEALAESGRLSDEWEPELRRLRGRAEEQRAELSRHHAAAARTALARD